MVKSAEVSVFFCCFFRFFLPFLIQKSSGWSSATSAATSLGGLGSMAFAAPQRCWHGGWEVFSVPRLSGWEPFFGAKSFRFRSFIFPKKNGGWTAEPLWIWQDVGMIWNHAFFFHHGILSLILDLIFESSSVEVSVGFTSAWVVFSKAHRLGEIPGPVGGKRTTSHWPDEQEAETNAALGKFFLAGCWSGCIMFHVFHVWDCWVSVDFCNQCWFGTFQNSPSGVRFFLPKKKAQLPRKLGMQDPRSVDHRWKPALSSTVCRIGLWGFLHRSCKENPKNHGVSS